MRKNLALGISGVLVVLALAACSAVGGLRTEKVLHYGLTLSPSGIDPHVKASSELGIPLAAVYDTLVFRDTQGGFVPGLAERWNISADGKEYTFHLRRDVKFHDGTVFNAAAAKANFDRILDPATKSEKARFLLGPVSGVEVADEYLLAFRLSTSYAPLLDALAQTYLGMASPAALAKWGADYQFHQVGTGPFRFVEYVPQDHLTLEKNPDYAWGPSIYRHAQAQLDKIIFRFYTDPATRAPALLSGEADVMGELLPADARRLEANGGYEVLPTPIPGQPLQFFLQTRLAPTDDPAVREAILRATDRVAIADAVFGGYSPAATGPLTASTWGAAAVMPVSLFDPAKAADLLQAAGWVDRDGDGIREKEGAPLAVKVVYPPWGMAPQVVELLAIQWKAVGMKAELIPVSDFSALKQAQQGGQYHLIAMNLAGTDPDLLRAFFQSNGIYNWAYVQDERLDMLLDKGMGLSDNAARLQAYLDVQNAVADQTLILPIRDYVNVNVASKKVRGLTFFAQGWWPMLIDVDLT